MVSVVLTNYFRKKFSFFFLEFCFHLLYFCGPIPFCSHSKIYFFLGVTNESRQIIQLLSNVCFNLNIIVLRKYWLIFELCHYFFILFLPSWVADSVKTNKNRFLVSHKLMFVMVLCSINVLFLFKQRAFKFFIFTRKGTFFEFILLPCQSIIIVANPKKEIHRKRTLLGKKRKWIW